MKQYQHFYNIPGYIIITVIKLNLYLIRQEFIGIIILSHHFILFYVENPSKFIVNFLRLTRPSKMSLWCTWIVINVSYLTRSTGLRSFVVISINMFRRSRKNWFVLRITFLSCLARAKASSESLVQIIWIPNNPTLGNIEVYAS